MSMTSEMNLMDLLFDKEDPSLHLPFDKDDLYPKSDLVDIDTKPSFGISSEVWPSNPDEFLDSLLNGTPFDDSILAENDISNPLSTELCLSGNGSLSPSTAIVSSSSSDSGMNSDVYSDVYSDVCGDQSTHDVAEDSGASVDLQMSPLKQEVEEDVDISPVQSMPASPEIVSSPEEFAHFDVLDSAVVSAGIFDSSPQLQLKNNTAIINMNLSSTDSDVPAATPHSNLSTQHLTLRPIKTWKRSGTGNGSATVRQMIRVTPMPAIGSSNSGHPRSILLPLQDLKDVRTIKIVNANNVANKRARCRPMVPAVGKGTPVTLLQVKPGNVLNTLNASPAQSCNISSSMSDIMNMSGDDSSDDSSDNTMDHSHSHSQNPYPRLNLSSEEKRLMEKEGVTLPTHYPLTKQEERELKRIRRKIRNKISAQDSRKRKKEYVDGLEDRVKQCTDENRELLKRLKILQSQNESLATQLQRLRTVVARGMGGSGSRAAQPATCLMVLLLSLALVMVPNLRPGNNSLEDQELSNAGAGLNSENKLPALPGRSRTLLHSSGAPLFAADSTDDMEFIDEEDLKLALPLLGKRHASILMDEIHQELGPPETKQSRYSIDPGETVRQYIDPAIDDVWPPNKQKDAFLPIDDRIESIVEQLLNNKTEEPSSTLVLPVAQEGR